MIVSAEIRAHREALVLEHIGAENVKDTERAMQTFTRPKYDLRAVDGEVIEGEDGVRDLIDAMRVTTPGVTYIADKIHHTDDAVIVEYRITGRHEGIYRGIGPTGAELNYPALAIFEFDGTDLVGERPYLNVQGLEAQMRGSGA